VAVAENAFLADRGWRDYTQALLTKYNNLFVRCLRLGGKAEVNRSVNPEGRAR
jgi:hypothetical protein